MDVAKELNESPNGARAEGRTGATLEILHPYVDEENEQVKEGGPWHIENLSSLDWALKRLGELEAEVLANESLTHDRIAELEQRCLRLNARAAAGMRFFRGAIEAYARSHRTQLLGSSNRKTRALIHGTVGWRKRPASLEVLDKSALLGWAIRQPVELGLVRMKEEPCMSEVKAYAEETGTIPPGCAPVPETDELQVRTVDPKEVL